MIARLGRLHRSALSLRIHRVSGRRHDRSPVAQFCNGTPATTTYIVCTNPRSGSWLLSEGLASTAMAGNPREWFNIQEEQQQRARWRIDHGSDLSLPAYLRLARAKSTTTNGVSGLKLHYYQLVNLPARLGLPHLTISQVIMRLFPGAKFIWLRRLDKVRQAISLLIASRTNEWWAIAGVSPERPTGSMAAPAFDSRAIARLESVLAQNDAKWESFFRENGITPLVINYEEMASDYPGTITSVLEWLTVAEVGSVAIPPPRL